MCMGLCLNKETYKVFHCIPLWFTYFVILLITCGENVMFLVDPIYMMPSAVLSLIMLLGICSCRSLQIRNCIWVTYLITALIQLMVTLVAFGLIILFPTNEECTQNKDEDGTVTYDCIELESKADASTVTFLLAGIVYFTLKTSCLVCFLHAFA